MAKRLTESEADKLRGAPKPAAADGIDARWKAGGVDPDAPVTMTGRDLADFSGEIIAAIAEQLKPIFSSMQKRIAALESPGGGGKIALAAYDANGKLTAEFWEDAGRVTLRVNGKRTASAKIGSDMAKRLLAKFEALGAEGML